MGWPRPINILPSLLLLLPAIPVAAQVSVLRQQKIDSLKSILATSSSAEVKCETLDELSRQYIEAGDYDTGSLYADSLAGMAVRYADKGNIADAHFHYGVIARNRGDYNPALDHLQQAIDYYVQSGDSSSVARALFHKGVVKVFLGLHDQSLAIFYRILDIHEKNGNGFGMGYTLNGIGVIYRNMDKYDEAINVFTRAIAIYDSVDALEDKAIALGNLGNVYISQKKPKEALDIYYQALNLDKAIGNEQSIAYDLGNIGVIHNDMGRHDSALVYQQRALKIQRNSGQKYPLAMILKQLGHTYLYLGNYKKAEEYLQQGLSVAKNINARVIERDIYEYLALVYAGTNEFPKAYSYQKQFSMLKDSVLNTDVKKQLNELQTKYETEKKDQQIVVLAQEKKLQETEARRQQMLKEASIVGALLIALLAVLTIYIFRQRMRNQRIVDRKDQEVKEANFKQQLTELEMKALQAQINPHFLFNCMNSINRMILDGENENASHYLAKFSKLVRLILENARASTVSLSNELELLESYIKLEQLRFKGRMEYKISVAPSIDPRATCLPPMVLQPFVENAIWHGLMHKPYGDQGLIDISILEKDGKLFCTIEDNGIGREKAMAMHDSSVLHKKSMGIKITEERLQLLGDKQLINIVDLKDPSDKAKGTRVEINIPILN